MLRRRRGAETSPSRCPGTVCAAVLAGACLFLAGPAPLQAQEGDDRAESSSAREAAVFLLVPLGARNLGFGGAMAGASADLEGALWNPAALAAVDRWAVAYHGSNDFGTSTHAISGVTRWRSARIGISLLAMDLGTIEGRDASNQATGTIDLANTLASLSVAHSIKSNIEVGVSYKFIRLGGSCGGCSGLEPDATGHAFDLAASLRPASAERLRVGLVVSNLGADVGSENGEAGDPLPTRVRLGGEMRLLASTSQRPFDLTARVDLQQPFAEFDDLDLFAGAEIGYRSLAFLRAGYAATGEGRSGPALSVGVRYEGFGLDLGRSFDDFAGFGEDSPYQVSVSYRP